MHKLTFRLQSASKYVFNKTVVSVLGFVRAKRKKKVNYIL